MDTIGILLAFILGAYIRKPFALKRVEKKEEETVDNEVLDFLKEEAKQEQKRQLQMYKALQWNGKKGRLEDED